ncbi:hypothetical protein [Taklimakanibacter albus]|uniref:Uncharacterized protein n=1 Tax=Taklimakanibacter albus TaxID=2800327 RepID=A0ACC5RAI5_9HYPH|nr:hypothetical protein [Aestuariivirga sp. YIM B02566]MBK1869696.1 hypothetical protein [Aestuariivirga sp. YIM B02566]
MTRAPTIRIAGAGSTHQAADLGRAVTKGVATALNGRDKPLHIDTLRVRLPANAGAGALEKAIRIALEKERGR